MNLTTLGTGVSFQFRNEQFFARSRTIPQDSGIGQPSGCLQGALDAPSQFKGLRGGVRRYIAQAIPQIDADSAVVAKKATMAKSAIAKKGHFWMETSLLRRDRPLQRVLLQ